VLKLPKLKGHDKGATTVAIFSPDGKTMASASHDTTIKLWDVSSGAARKTVSDHKNPVLALCFSPDGRMLASRSADLTVRLWDGQSGEAIRMIRVHHESVFGV
jgi:WD40 repeat protein